MRQVFVNCWPGFRIVPSGTVSSTRLAFMHGWSPPETGGTVEPGLGVTGSVASGVCKGVKVGARVEGGAAVDRLCCAWTVLATAVAILSSSLTGDLPQAPLTSAAHRTTVNRPLFAFWDIHV